MIELIFAHGWGFDAYFWNPLAALLSDYPQRRIDRGYFGREQNGLKTNSPAILIGHSFGFLYGLQQRQSWAGLVAINSFARFLEKPGEEENAGTAALRNMRMRLAADPAKTLRDFYALIGANPHMTMPNAERLRDDLDKLRDLDVSQTLSSLTAPFLVLAARNDALVPARASKALAGCSRHARLEWHKTGNHVLPQSHAAWCAGLIKKFMQSIS